MRWFFLFLVLVTCSCQPLSETEKQHRDLTGNWLIVYPDDELKNPEQEAIYSRIQDSIISLSGLKLVRFRDNGAFQQVDSIDQKGKWGFTANNMVFVENGGKGFEHFAAKLVKYENKMLLLSESVEIEGEKIELIWNLKKITGGFADDLFGEKNNAWRKRPAQPESESQMRKRLAEMLQYHSDYFKLVNREASFFVTTRSILPFKFYQHAIGMWPREQDHYFRQLFYDRQQSELAWSLLKRSINKLSRDYPKTKNYVQEYSDFLGMMASDMEND